MTAIVRPFSPPHSKTAPSDPAQLRTELLSEEFWTENASRFVACAAYLAGDDADAAQAIVLAATKSILSGERRCPGDMPAVRFVLTVIAELAAEG